MAKKKKAAKRPDEIRCKTAKNGKSYFTRVAPNGEQVFRSQLYAFRQGRNKAVNRIKEKEGRGVIIVRAK